MRPSLIKKAIAAGKHVYCEKPSATNLAEAMEIYEAARKAGVKHGVVQDKLWLPGLLKLKMLIDSGYFGRILSVRGEFGYWVFEGDLQPAQRPSWNYRKEDGGGIILDMLCHWRYVVDNLFGNVKSVSCLGATHIPQRWDENGKPYAGDRRRRRLRHLRDRPGRHRPLQQLLVRARAPRRPADPASRRHPWLGGGHAARLPHPASGQHAEAGMEPRPAAADRFLRRAGRKCPTASCSTTPSRRSGSFSSATSRRTRPFPWGLREGAKGVQLVEAGLQSWRERRWVDVGELPA